MKETKENHKKTTTQNSAPGKDNLKDYAFVNADVPEVQPLEKAESLGKKDWMCTTMMYNTKTLELVDR